MKAINDTPTPILDGETAFVDFYRNQHQRTFRLARLLTKPVDPTTNTLYTTPSPPLRKHANRTNNPPESSQQPPSNPPSPPSMSQQQPRVLNQHGAQQPSSKTENPTRPLATIPETVPPDHRIDQPDVESTTRSGTPQRPQTRRRSRTNSATHPRPPYRHNNHTSSTSMALNIRNDWSPRLSARLLMTQRTTWSVDGRSVRLARDQLGADTAPHKPCRTARKRRRTRAQCQGRVAR